MKVFGIFNRNKDYKQEVEFQSDISGLIDEPFLHDISTPISSLSCVLELIPRNKQNEEIFKQARYSLKQIHNLVSSTDILTGNKSCSLSFNVASQIRCSAKIFSYYFKRAGISLKLELSPKIYLTGNKIVFSRIIVNLLKNSFEELLNSDVEAKAIFISAFMKNEELIIKIADTGRGIPKDKLNGIFKRGFSSKGSSGLGLWFVKENLQKYFKGRISVENLDKGCEFLISIPVSIS